jgi:uncharacterized repeat protein (TIGR03806 family)
MRKVAALALLWVLLAGFNPPQPPLKLHLSEYDFFQGALQNLQPSADVHPYSVNAPLFSDYAEKARFVFVPKGLSVQYKTDSVWEFPAGVVLIKHFFYYQDAGQPGKGRKILETRLLILGDQGWKPATYIWNEAQTDADLEVAGSSFPVQWVDADHKRRNLDYVVPNLNQCKGCHSYDGQFQPIGPTTRQLNRDAADGTGNQLVNWRNKGWLVLPAGFDPVTAPRLTDYRDVTASVESRARAYLEGNCAHCHNPHGPASTSGMFLDSRQTDPAKLGVWKAPVAAGQGSGGLKFGIVPGKPSESIMVFRMENEAPGIRMPELGRQLEHKEGVALIKAWVKAMKP